MGESPLEGHDRQTPQGEDATPSQRGGSILCKTIKGAASSHGIANQQQPQHSET